MFASATNVSIWEIAVKFLNNIVFTVVKIKENREGQILPLDIPIYFLLTLRGKILTFHIWLGTKTKILFSDDWSDFQIRGSQIDLLMYRNIISSGRDSGLFVVKHHSHSTVHSNDKWQFWLLQERGNLLICRTSYYRWLSLLKGVTAILAIVASSIYFVMTWLFGPVKDQPK